MDIHQRMRLHKTASKSTESRTSEEGKNKRNSCATGSLGGTKKKTASSDGSGLLELARQGRSSGKRVDSCFRETCQIQTLIFVVHYVR